MYSISSPSGALVSLGAPQSAANGASYVAVSPNNQYFYCACRDPGNIDGASTIHQYSINPSTALLSPLSPSSIPDAGASAIAINPAGTYFLTIAENDGAYRTIYVVSINGDGTLGGVTSSATTGYGSTCLAIHPSGDYVYATSPNDQTLSQYSLVGGILTPLSPASVSNGDSYCVALHPNGNFAYSPDCYHNLVNMYSISSGLLNPLSPSSVPIDAPGPRFMAINPAGTFAYVVSDSSRLGPAYWIISMFAINSGVLSRLSPFSLNIGAQPVSVAVDPSGSFVYVTTTSNTVVMYAINTGTGELSLIGAGSIATGNGPNSIAFASI
jgi:6-phosphogluconolactonase (cycloisomerase 2 family)